MQQDPIVIDMEQYRALQGKQRRRGRSCAGCGCATLGILLGVGGGLLGIAVAILAVAAPNVLTGFLGGLTGIKTPETRAIAGDASRFDPFAAYPQALALAGEGAQLIAIRVSQVRADGTQNLNAEYAPPQPDTEYKFIRKVAPPANAPPVGAGGNTGNQWYEPVTVRAYRPGARSTTTTISGGVSVRYDFVNEGFARNVSSLTTSVSQKVIDAPTCSIVDFWKAGIAAGFPPDAVASLTLDASGYRFYIAGQSNSLSFDLSCEIQK